MNDVVPAEEGGALDTVFQFPDVARPVVTHEQINSGRGDAADSFVVNPVVFFNEIVGEEEDVGSPFSEGREVDAEGVGRSFNWD